MSIERNLRLALHQLVEAIEYTPMGVRGIKAMDNARKALEAAQQPATGEPMAGEWFCGNCRVPVPSPASHPAPGVPEGYVLVPIEPTEKMLRAYTGGALTEAGFRWCRHQWAVMLAAAQEPS